MVIIIYFIILFSFTIYSYSQIDLNLTLSSFSLYQSFQKQLIYLGYFNRPLSTAIYLTLLFLFFIFYFLFLWLIKQKKLTLLHILLLIIGSSVILFFAYPAFSHDIFNYMFDARIVTKYFSNPYFHSALDYPNDLWTRFMHWTHRTYPYGPFWLLLTLPFSYLGIGKFVLTLFNFKLMFTLFHLGNIFMIYKIIKQVSPKDTFFGVSFYALNPLIVIESLISPHNEVMMLFFLLLAIYISFAKKSVFYAVFSLLLSAGIKFIPIILLPLFIAKIIRPHNFGKINYFLKLSLVILILPLIIQIIYREPYPWYFIPFIGMAALLSKSQDLRNIMIGLSFGTMLRYAPYLYEGDYTSQVKLQQNILFAIPIILVFGWWLVNKLFKKIML